MASRNESGNDDLSALHSLLRYLCGASIETNLTGDFLGKLLLDVTKNGELTNFMLKLAEGSYEDPLTAEKLLKHPFIQNTLHSPDDLVEYLQNYEYQGFRPMPSILSAYTPGSRSLKHHFEQVWNNFTPSEFTEISIANELVSYRAPEKRRIAEFILLSSEVKFVAMGSPRLFILRVKKNDTGPAVLIHSTQSTISIGDLILVVTLAYPRGQFPVHDGKRWANELKGCGDDELQGCTDSLSRIEKQSGGARFALHRIVPN